MGAASVEEVLSFFPKNITEALVLIRKGRECQEFLHKD